MARERKRPEKEGGQRKKVMPVAMLKLIVRHRLWRNSYQARCFGHLIAHEWID